jgi:hypothetical protein
MHSSVALRDAGGSGELRKTVDPSSDSQSRDLERSTGLGTPFFDPKVWIEAARRTPGQPPDPQIQADLRTSHTYQGERRTSKNSHFRTHKHRTFCLKIGISVRLGYLTSCSILRGPAEEGYLALIT